MTKLNGQDITDIRTMSSAWDSGKYILVTDCGGKSYRMDVKEFLKVINDVRFNIVQKRVHKHLTINSLKGAYERE